MHIHGCNRNRAERGKIDAEAAKIVYGLAADELAANFVMGGRRAFEQDDLAPCARQMRGNGSTGDAAADDDRVGRHFTRPR
jgi:hypothetical protein